MCNLELLPLNGILCQQYVKDHNGNSPYIYASSAEKHDVVSYIRSKIPESLT